MPGLSIQYSSKAINVNSKNVDETSFVHDEVAAIKNQIKFGTLSLKLLLGFFPPHQYEYNNKNSQNNHVQKKHVGCKLTI